MSVGGKGGDDKEVTQTSEPWSQQARRLPGIYNRAKELSEVPLEYYPDKGYVDFRPQTREALGRIENRARRGSPLTEAGNEAMLATARGDMLNANPYLDDMMDAASQGVVRNYRDAVLPGIDLARLKSGRSGSNAHDSARGTAYDRLGDALSNLSARIYGGNYATERGNQMRAAGMAPSYAAADYADMDRLMGVGGAYEGLDEAALSDAMARHTFEQEDPWERLQRYSSFVQGGNWGGTSTTSQPTYRSPLASGLGGAATAGGLASMLGATGPWGWGAALGGGLLGLAA